MQSVYQAILAIITSPAGILTYHLILAFTIVWSLQASITVWRSGINPSSRRLVTGFSLLLISRIALFAVGVAISTGMISSAGILPSLDRAINAFSLLIIIWLWAFPEPVRLADAATILLSLLVITLLALSLTWTSAQPDPTPFSQTDLNSIWEGFSVFLAASGILILLVRRPNSWEFGLSMLLILFVGHLVETFWPVADQDFPTSVRLAQLAAYPFLLVLPQRYYAAGSISQPRQGINISATQHDSLTLINRWFEIENSKTSEQILLALPEYTTQVFPVDLACILTPITPDLTEFSISAFNDTNKQFLDNQVVTGAQLPILLNALRRNRPLRLHASSSSADLEILTTMLEIERADLIAVPIFTKDKILKAGLILMNLDTLYTWTNEDQNKAVEFARGIATSLNQFTAKGKFPAILPPETGILSENDVGPVLTSNKSDEEVHHSKLAELGTASLIFEQLKTENEKLRQELIHWQESGSSQNAAQIEDELRQTLAELALLQQQLVDVDQRALKNNQMVDPMDTENIEVIVSTVQELRQPMSSIMGYTDLLLGESVGILGALQRKFLERIKASTERMGALIEDLIQLVSLDDESADLTPVDVDLNKVIDDAITHTIARMKEKNIALLVDIPSDLPHIKADQDALQQVVIHLLQNAEAASPVDGEIVLAVQNAQDDFDDDDYILLQVSDSGGGIPVEDLPRVFSRLYRADNPLIQGVGDTGVGLSVAKNLVEALHGRIWVDTELGQGSTFSILLPVLSNGKTQESWELK